VFSLAALDQAAEFIRPIVPPSPQIAWPLLAERLGARIWVKHENHLPTGAFKVRGGLMYLDHVARTEPGLNGVITATRGNHGQSVAFAAQRLGIRAVIVVPHGNSAEKNAAMRAFGAELVEQGHDFQAAREWAAAKAAEEGLHMVPAWHPMLVRGVATAGLELLRAVPDLDTLYVPIGMGSGICGMIAARDALNRAAEVVGVVAEGAPAYALSLARGAPVATDRADTFADGIATRSPDPEAFARIRAGAARIVQVSDDSIREAMRHYFTDIHQVAEGAGAAPLAAALQERERLRGRKVGVVLSGGNVDREVYAEVLRQ
jgi:threonine dehydratase